MEKKSERMEVRLGFQEKQEFTKACDTQGDTPSGAIRRFISGYTRRANADLLSSAWRGFKYNRLVLSGLLIILALSSIIGFRSLISQKSLNYSLEGASPELIAAVKAYPRAGVTRPIQNDPADIGPPLQEVLFKKWDQDNSGIIELGEILPNDNHLHRVLDTDGISGISLAEFYAKGRMVYNEVDDLIVDDKSEQLSYRYTGASLRRVVDFNLTGSRPQIAVYLVTSDTSSMQPDRSIVWLRGKLTPAVNFSHNDYRPRNLN